MAPIPGDPMDVIFGKGAPVGRDRGRAGHQHLHLHTPKGLHIQRTHKGPLGPGHELLALLAIRIPHLDHVIGDGVVPASLQVVLPGNHELGTNLLGNLDGRMNALAVVHPAEKQKVVAFVRIELEIIGIKVVGNHDVIPILLTLPDRREVVKGMVDGMRLENLVFRPVPSRIPYAGLDAYEVLVGVTHRASAGAPERQNEVAGPLAHPNLPNGVLIERLVGMVACVKLKKLFAPIIVTVGNIPIIVGNYRYMLITYYIRVFMTVMYYVVSPVLHHFTEFEHLLCICASHKVVTRDRMR